MKKILACALALCMICGATAFAAGTVPNSNTEITATVDEAYVVTIPTAVSLAYGATSTSLTISVSGLRLLAGNKLYIKPQTYAGLLENASKNMIAYVLMNGQSEFSKANPLIFTANGSQSLNLTITAAAWSSAAAGAYSDTVTFTVSAAQ